MGHYYSEMHVETYQEKYLQKVKAAREEFGFLNYDLDYRHWFICSHCSCMIMNPSVHIANCAALSQATKDSYADSLLSAKYQIIAALCRQATISADEPWIERFALLAECEVVGLDAFIFDAAIAQLRSAGEIKEQHLPLGNIRLHDYVDKRYMLVDLKEQA